MASDGSEHKGLDAALAALSAGASTSDDDRWALRVASRLSTFSPVSRREVEPLLGSPFPDDFVDEETLELTDASGGHDAAFAADGISAAGGWEGSMSDDFPRGPSSGGLSGLAGLTRSGPPSSVKSDSSLGAAKGDDSGLIDLRAVTGAPEASEAANDAPAPAPAPASDSKPIAAIASAASAASAAPIPAGPPTSVKSGPVSAPVLAAAGLLKSERPPAPASAVVPPSTLPASSVAASSTSAAANSVPAASTSEKKKGAGLWIAFGGLAAAAAVAFAVLPSMKRDEAPASTAAAPQANEGADKKAVEPPAPAVASAAPTVTATATATEAAPDPAATVAAGGTAAKPSTPGAAPMMPGGKPVATAAPAATTAPVASAAAAPTTDPIKKPAGGSLDDVLGIGKDQPVAKAAPTENLPDKPDAMDVRSAINSKLGAARACAKGLEESSSVSVTFSPAGTVSAVSVVSGPAKGTGAESCIKNAFSGAKVPPSKKGASGSAVVQP